MASYNKFNYTYRPAKSIERKLFIELLKELYGVTDSRNCTYIGFGSIFFVDFKMIHKELGIKSMINIEANEDDKRRFEFNRPFSCIKFLWGKSTEKLLEIDWKGKKIIWMDYDETLQSYMFEDINTIFSNLVPNSFYFFTCNCSFPKYRNKDTGIYNLDAFSNDFDGYVPYDLTQEMLMSNQSPDLLRGMILSHIHHVLEMRNAILEDPEKLIFSQMLYLTYKDGAPMFSFGGMLVKKKDLISLRNTKIFSLPYVKSKTIRLDIQSPILTNSEIDLINSHLPKSKKVFLKLKKIGFIPEDDREKYHTVYRYYPSYVEIRE